MNEFDYSLYINEKLYNIYVDSSRDEWKRIVINNVELVNEKYTLTLNRKAYMIYYPIKIGDNELVISIDDAPLSHKYNLYLNNVSVIDGTILTDDYEKSKAITENGFRNFAKKNWKNILKDNLLWLIAPGVISVIILLEPLDKLILRKVIAILLLPIMLPLFVIFEWWHNKNVVKKFNNCFRSQTFIS